jgi:DNA-binding transcriptional LysR family regulator
MDWDALRIFLAVARAGQLLGAARRLGLNHATVARRLDALEAATGSPLFVRTPSGSALTEAGERLLPIAERMEAEALTAAEAMRPEQAGVSGTVRIGAPDGLGNLFLAGALGGLVQQHPALQIELVPLPRAFSLSRREADLAIGLERPTEGRVVSAKLSDYSLGVYASRAYLKRAGEPAALEDLGSHCVVSGVAEFTWSPALDYGAALEERAGSLFRCASVIGQLAAIRAGIGIGVMHDFAAAPHADLVRVLPDTAFVRAYWLMSHPDTFRLRRVAACRSFLVNQFAAARPLFLPGVPEAGAG